jgi:hypothetical protein
MPDEDHIGARISVIEARAEERDRKYNELDAARQEAIRTALASMRDQTAAAFAASEKAIQAALIAVKEQTAAAFLAAREAVSETKRYQESYNQSAGILTNAMKAQSDTMISRTEANSRTDELDRKIEELKGDFSKIRDMQSQQSGSKATQRENWGYLAAAFMAILAFASLIFAIYKG